MKLLGLTISFLLLLTSCKETNKENFDLNLFPKEWVKLTDKDGKLVIYNSCDAGNMLLTISKKSDRFELLIHGQQEDYNFEILETTQLIDTIYIKAKWKDYDEEQEFKFYWKIKEQGLGRFNTTYSNGLKSDNLFVTREKQTNFEKFDQPCRECWGDECDEIEKKIEKTDKPIIAIKKILDNYVKYQESTDAQDNRDLMTNSLISLDKVTKPDELEILINVWMYYDPIDFPSRKLTFNVLQKSRPESMEAIKTRIKNKKEWETDDTAPYSELNYLLQELDK
jgi:hypothetical protein